MMSFAARLFDVQELEAFLRSASTEALGAELYRFATTHGVEWGHLEMRATELHDKLVDADIALGFTNRLPRLVFAGPPPGTAGPVPGFGYIDLAQAGEIAKAVQELVVKWSSECSQVPGLDGVLEFIESACARAATLEMGVLFFAL